MLGVVFIMETFENAKIFCSNYPSDNAPKRGEKYYFENDNIKTYAIEIENDVFNPNCYGARFFFTKFQKVLIDGVYQNQSGTFVGYWYKNGAYRTCNIKEIFSIDCQKVLTVGLI